MSSTHTSDDDGSVQMPETGDDQTVIFMGPETFSVANPMNSAESIQTDTSARDLGIPER